VLEGACEACGGPLSIVAAAVDIAEPATDLLAIYPPCQTLLSVKLLLCKNIATSAAIIYSMA
jgi:hypothetical protein